MSDFKSDYIAAYLAFNPTRRAPIIVQRNGWCYMTTFDAQGHSFVDNYRKAKLIAMTANLRSKVEQKITITLKESA